MWMLKIISEIILLAISKVGVNKDVRVKKQENKAQKQWRKNEKLEHKKKPRWERKNKRKNNKHG